jgi:hypothetical protein
MGRTLSTAIKTYVRANGITIRGFRMGWPIWHGGVNSLGLEKQFGREGTAELLF